MVNQITSNIVLKYLYYPNKILNKKIGSHKNVHHPITKNKTNQNKISHHLIQ